MTEVPRLTLLIVTLAYWTAGVHLDRRLLWIAVAVAACYLFTIVRRDLPHLWTLTASVMAASLLVCGIFTAARERQQRMASGHEA